MILTFQTQRPSVQQNKWIISKPNKCTYCVWGRWPLNGESPGQTLPASVHRWQRRSCPLRSKTEAGGDRPITAQRRMRGWISAHPAVKHLPEAASPAHLEHTHLPGEKDGEMSVDFCGERSLTWAFLNVCVCVCTFTLVHDNGVSTHSMSPDQCFKVIQDSSCHIHGPTWSRHNADWSICFPCPVILTLKLRPGDKCKCLLLKSWAHTPSVHDSE